MEGASGDDRSEAACVHRRDPRVKPGGRLWAKTNMTRTHGRCPRGERLVAKAPFGRWRTLPSAALRCDRLTAPCVIDGPINGASFRAYVEQVLAPILAPGDLVVMDNLGSHKGRAVRAAIRAAKAKLFPARLLAGPQSDRTGLRQNEDPVAQGRRPDNRRDLANHRRPARLLHPDRMRKRLQERRICFNLTRSRFSGWPTNLRIDLSNVKPGPLEFPTNIWPPSGATGFLEPSADDVGPDAPLPPPARGRDPSVAVVDLLDLFAGGHDPHRLRLARLAAEEPRPAGRAPDVGARILRAGCCCIARPSPTSPIASLG